MACSLQADQGCVTLFAFLEGSQGGGTYGQRSKVGVGSWWDFRINAICRLGSTTGDTLIYPFAGFPSKVSVNQCKI